MHHNVETRWHSAYAQVPIHVRLSTALKRDNLRVMAKGLAVVDAPGGSWPPNRPVRDGHVYTVLYGGDTTIHVLVEWDSAERASVSEMRIKGRDGRRDLLAEDVRDIPLGRIVALIEGLGAPDEEAPPPLPRRTRGTPDPEEFARLLARHYRYQVKRTSSPAKAIADEHGVPVSRVHRWIREARELQILPPGRQGRAG